MFGSKRPPTKPDEIETVIGKETKIKGNITAGGSIRIDGTLEGDLAAAGHVIIGESGVIKAAIKAKSVTVAGTVTGNLDVIERLELLPTAKIHGDIVAGVLVVGEGAVFTGNCIMRNNQDQPKEKEKEPAKEPKLGLVKNKQSN